MAAAITNFFIWNLSNACEGRNEQGDPGGHPELHHQGKPTAQEQQGQFLN
jgi:hypothetical protein